VVGGCLWLRLAALGLAIAGGGGCTGRAAPIETGLPPSQAMSSLSDAEADQLCSATARAIAEGVTPVLDPEAQCVLHGVAVAWWEGWLDFERFYPRCEAARKQCAADPIGFLTGCRPETPCKCDPLFRALLDDCPETVGTWEACTGAMLHAVDLALEGCSCETPGPCVAVLTQRACRPLVDCIVTPL
jgi:hypothetical protein